ncbi:MAG: glycosyl hydrolase family 32 [Bacteroidota bacterium]
MRTKYEKFRSISTLSRRKFLKNSIITGTAGVAAISYAGGVAALSGQQLVKSSEDAGINPVIGDGELLYNGIYLPAQWPPRYMKPDSFEPMPIPYLISPPEVIPIDVGRQLFVDNFLIEYTNLKREFHQPVKYEGNPVLKPETKVEMNQGFCPMAAPFSDGCFYDPKDKLFKLWYMAGWFDGTALVTSSDGINWERPKLDVVPGTNLVLAPRDDFRRDGLSVWLDHESKDPAERFKMYVYERKGKVGERLTPVGGFQLTSPDGIHWKWCGKIGETGDNSTFFYNPFRKQWVFTVRTAGRPAPPWDDDPKWGGGKSGRARSYWENNDFLAALERWEGYDPVFWFGVDKLDPKHANYDIGSAPQIYKVDAVGYESLMLGLIQPHYGPPNEVCAKGGFPKLTELQLAFSRDGFHWDRTCRETFICAKPHEKDSWERGYIHSIGGVCNVVDDKLYFYYTSFQGNESNLNPLQYWSGLYANASTNLAVLRRDGFASMEATKEDEILLTRPVTFSGKHLFVNVDGPRGRLYAEVCQQDGKPVPGFTRDDCMPISTDSTKCLVEWKDKDNLESLAGKPVRLKFYLTNSKIYAFWVSQNSQGVSGGATAAGGPGLTGYWDK